jgi:hypothetical protein
MVGHIVDGGEEENLKEVGADLRVPASEVGLRRKHGRHLRASSLAPSQTAIGASIIWAIFFGGRHLRQFSYGGRRFSNRAPQTPPQKRDAAHFIVDSAQIFEKGISANDPQV